MNYFEFIKRKVSFFENVKNKFEVKIDKDKLNLISFLEKKELYIAYLNKTLGYKISNDISISDLEALEITLKNKKDLITDEIMFALCYLIGEVIIKELGGNWEIGKLKKDWAYGFPIILNWGRDGKDHMRLCPIEWIFSYKHNRLRLETFSKMILQDK